MVSVLIFTKNEQQDLPACLASVAWCDDVHVLDSFSTDRTVELARAAGAHVTQRPFDNWAAHQNFAARELPFKHPWVVHLDADERVPEALAKELLAIPADDPCAAFRIRRRDYFFDGAWLKYVQVTPWYVRLFRPQKIRYERLVHQVAVVDGAIGELTEPFDHYPFSKGIGFWLERHIRYAAVEAGMLVQQHREPGLWRTALFGGDFHQRRVHQKRLFYQMPCRPLVKFLYLILWRRAFLDGRAGLAYALLMAIYEYFIVLHTRELRLAAKATAPKAP
jgi:glycosyltransferase involved in cell wall biosynthesis